MTETVSNAQMQPVRIRLDMPALIPTREAIEGMASALHRAGKRWRGDAWGWPAEYIPEEQGEAEEIIAMTQGTVKSAIRPFYHPARFTIGVRGVWSVDAAWYGGPDAPPMWEVHDENVVEVVAEGIA